MRFIVLLVCVWMTACASLSHGEPQPVLTPRVVSLSSLHVTRAMQTWGRPSKNLAVSGKPLSIAGQRFADGFGTHASSRLYVSLLGRAETFSGQVGVDDGGNKTSSVEFRVIGDGKTLWSSGNPHPLGPAAPPP